MKQTFTQFLSRSQSVPLNGTRLRDRGLGKQARRCLTTLAILGFCILTQTASARHTRVRAHLKTQITPFNAAALLEPGTLPAPDDDMSLTGHEYRLNLKHLHTGESLSVVYRVGDTYIPSAMDQLNHFLRDHRTDDVSNYDPTEFDLLYNLMSRLGRPRGEIDIVCGYRTPQTNAMLRSLSPETGVAEHSQHILAKAIDIRVPGVQTRRLRDAALSLDAGGVGYYPRSQFVHVDVGPVRQWSFGGARGRHHARHKRQNA